MRGFDVAQKMLQWMVSGQQSARIICRLSELLTFYLASFPKEYFLTSLLIILISFLAYTNMIFCTV